MTFTLNHWSNEKKSKQLLDNVIFPYLKKKEHDLGLPGDQKSLLIYDVFTGQTTENKDLRKMIVSQCMCQIT